MTDVQTFLEAMIVVCDFGITILFFILAALLAFLIGLLVSNSIVMFVTHRGPLKGNCSRGWRMCGALLAAIPVAFLSGLKEVER